MGSSAPLSLSQVVPPRLRWQGNTLSWPGQVRQMAVWQALEKDAQDAIATFNKKVDNYNIAVPSKLHLFRVNVERDFARLAS